VPRCAALSKGKSIRGRRKGSGLEALPRAMGRALYKKDRDKMFGQMNGESQTGFHRQNGEDLQKEKAKET